PTKRRSSSARMSLGVPPSLRSHSGAPVSTRRASTRPLVVATYTRSAASAGAACAGDPISWDQIWCPSDARNACTLPSIVATTSQPLSQTGRCAGLSARGNFHASEPVSPSRAVRPSGSAKISRPSPVLGSNCGCAETIHFCVPVVRSYATIRSEAMEKKTCVASYAGGTVSGLLSASVQTLRTGKSASGASDFDSAARTPAQQTAMITSDLQHMVVNTGIIPSTFRRLDEVRFRFVSHQAIIVLDFGSQYTQLIARRLRELSVYSEVWSPDTPIERIRDRSPAGIILSGGPKSVSDPGAPKCDPGVYDIGRPVLGICYG